MYQTKKNHAKASLLSSLVSLKFYAGDLIDLIYYNAHDFRC